MRIYSLKFKNFMRLKKGSMNFSDKDIVAFTGPNQLGKSSIMESLTYVLFGASRAEKETELIHTGEDAMYVQLTLTDGEKRYTIKRGRDIKNNGLLEVDWIDKTKNAQAEIENIIGMDKEEFFKTTYFAQGEISELMDMRPAQKEKFLMKWFDFSAFERAEKKAKEKLSVLIKERTDYKSKVDFLKEKCDAEIEFDSEIELHEETINLRQESVDEVEKKITELSKSLTMTKDEHEELVKSLKRKKRERDDIDSELEDINLLKEKLKALEDKKSALEDSIGEAGGQEELNKVVGKGQKVRAEIETLKEHVERMTEHGEGICPILNEGCDRIKASKKDIENKKDEIKKLKKKKSELTEKYESIKKEMEQEKVLTDTIHKIEMLTQQVANEGKLKKSRKEKKSEIIKLKKQVDSYDSETPEKIEELKVDKKRAVKELDQAKQDLSDIKARYNLYKENKKSIKDFKEKIKKLDLKIDRMKYVAVMFGKDGIPSQQIENGFQEIEDEANYILSKMNGMEVIFRPYKETGGKETFCSACGFVFPKGYRKTECEECGEPRGKKKNNQINFEVFKDGRKYPYHMDSTGGKAIISTAIRTALTQFSKRNNKCLLNAIFLDEPDAPLDDKNSLMFFKLVTEVFLEVLGIEQVFWVSHNPEIKTSLNYVLQVVDKGTYSEFKWL